MYQKLAKLGQNKQFCLIKCFTDISNFVNMTKKLNINNDKSRNYFERKIYHEH